MLNKTLRIQYGARNKRLSKMSFSDYKEYLKSDTWRSIKEEWGRRKVTNTKFWGECRLCFSKENLVLHHTKYGNVNKIIMSGFIPVCNSCHHNIHLIAHSPKFKGGLKSATKKWKKIIQRKLGLV